MDEREALRSAIATAAAALTQDALEDHWGLIGRADELQDVLSYMYEADAGILGDGADDHDVLEWLRNMLREVVYSCDLDVHRARRRGGAVHSATWRVRFAAEMAARKLSVLVGEYELLPVTHQGPELNCDPVRADRIMAAYRAERGIKEAS